MMRLARARIVGVGRNRFPVRRLFPIRRGPRSDPCYLVSNADKIGGQSAVRRADEGHFGGRVARRPGMDLWGLSSRESSEAWRQVRRGPPKFHGGKCIKATFTLLADHPFYGERSSFGSSQVCHFLMKAESIG